MPSKIKLEQYYDDFDPATNYTDVLFRADRTLQSRELNEAQHVLQNRVKGIADAMLANGDIIRDCRVAVDSATGETRCEAGAVYLEGMVRNVAAAALVIPVTGSVSIGVYLHRSVITELEDSNLYNHAVGTRGEGEPGAARLQEVAVWGYSADGQDGDFYPVHFVDDGIVRSKEAPPNLDAFNQGLARYDRDHTGGGTYIATGFVVRSAGVENGKQIYTVSEGRARVWGYGIELPTSRRLAYGAAPDLRYVDTEIHTADGAAGQRIDVAHAPIFSVEMLRVTLKKSVSIVHGAYAGVADALPDSSTVAILECSQGDTVYGQGADYKKNGDKVDWSLPGNEPAPGSTYSVTYTYMAAVKPVDQDYDGFTVEGAVEGSSIILSYYQAVQRYDRLCVTQDGVFVWQQGVAAENNPRKPAAPDGVLALASVLQTWRDAPKVLNDGIHVVTFDTLETMSGQISDLFQEVARQRLESDIATRESGARAGIFVDPLLNDDMRDQGIAQDAAVSRGWLTLPIAPTVSALAAPLGAPATLAYNPVIVLAQTLRTGSMAVNPYMSFDVLPARITLTPPIDQFTEVETQWASAVTERFDVYIYAPETLGTALYGQVFLSDQRSSTQTLSSAKTALEYLRQISIAFHVEGFGPGEELRSVLFDGVAADFTAGPANAAGVVTGSFTIPPKIAAGAKTVAFHGGDGGSEGSAVFVGQGMLTVQTLRQVNTVTYSHIDPLAQTFVLDATTQICGVDLYFTAKSGEVRVQIREVQNGVPTRVILAEAVLAPKDIVVTGGGHTRALFPALVQLSAGVEYAVVVLCNDPDTALSVAEMGKFDDIAQKWVSAQPYTVGVLLSSSNASTWTAHQDKDMAFRLLEASFPETTRQIDMGETPVSGATDLVILAVDESPTSDTRVEYALTLPDGNTLTVAQGQPARLATPVTGPVKVTAKLVGTNRAAPLLWPGAQLLSGTIGEIAEYYSRSIPAFDAHKAVLIYDASIPSGAAVTPEIQVDGGAWQSLEQTGAVTQGNGIVEYRFESALADADLVKARLTLTGTSAARPFVGTIRFMAIK